MKRNMDLVRAILLAAEEVPAGQQITKIVVPRGVTKAECLGHVEILIDAGFIKGHVNDYLIGTFRIDRITWHGLDFLQATKDEKIWNKAKKHVMVEAGSWTIGLLLEYLRREAAQKLGFPVP